VWEKNWGKHILGVISLEMSNLHFIEPIDQVFKILENTLITLIINMKALQEQIFYKEYD
jgi:hypothetical protein